MCLIVSLRQCVHACICMEPFHASSRHDCVQMTQRKVETTLQEMMEQKNKLAYENGKLQSQVTQLTQDLAAAQAQCSDTAQLRKASEMAQARLVQVSVTHVRERERERVCMCV